MVWLSYGEKLEDKFIHFGGIHERDRQTDGRTNCIWPIVLSSDITVTVFNK